MSLAETQMKAKKRDSARFSMEDASFCCSQLGAGDDVLRDGSSQALPGGDEARASQPLADSGRPQAAFRCMYGVQHGASEMFSLSPIHGSKLYLGRAVPQHGVQSGQRVVLTSSATHGISRDNGWIEYDQHRGVLLVPLQRTGFPAFHNCVLLMCISYCTESVRLSL